MGAFIDNPVLSKEIRSRLRARKQGRANRIAAIIMTCAVVTLLYYFGGRAILRSDSGSNAARDMYMVFTIMIQATLVLFLVPALTAGAITQEREQQTWNALLLSRLTPEEIVVGKLVASLLPAFVVLAVFAPLGLLAAAAGDIPAGQYLLSNLLLVTSAVFYAAIALFCSWAYRRTYIATAASFGIVAFFAVGTLILYGLWQTAHPGNYVRVEEFVPMWLNPYMAHLSVVENLNGSGSGRNMSPALFHIFASVVGTLVLTGTVIGRLSRGPKELEQ